MKYNLGGIGRRPNGYVTVNMIDNCDIQCDIMDLDKFCSDGSVDEFLLEHTLEHIPITEYKQFILNLYRKLKPGGTIKVIQSDSGAVIKMWANNEISFRAMRGVIFTPANRMVDNILQQHQSMWSQEELCNDFKSIGMAAEGFDAGHWPFDVIDDIVTDSTIGDMGKPIKNLGVIATKI